MKTALVMEGGAMRGMYTCGVIDVLMEHNIYLDGAIGVSAGAAFGCNYKSKQIGRPIRYNKRFCNDKRYASIGSLLKTGDLYNAEFCYHTLPYELDWWDADTFAANPMEFYMVVTDVETGKPVYHKSTDGKDCDLLWMRASASMPVASKPVAIDGGKYLDGGISDPIPLKYMEDLGYDRIVVVETQPVDYVKQPQKYMGLIAMFLRGYPAIIRGLQDRHLLYNQQKSDILEKEARGEVFVIRPDAPLQIGSREKDPAQLERVYQEGRRIMEARLPELQTFLRADVN